MKYPERDLIEESVRLEAERALFDPSIDVIIIRGLTGTGKTTLRRHLMRLALLSGPTLCLLPTTVLSDLEWDAVGGQDKGDLTIAASKTALAARAFQYVFIEDLPERVAVNGENEASLVALAQSRVAGRRGGKVIVVGGDLGNHSRMRQITVGGSSAVDDAIEHAYLSVQAIVGGAAHRSDALRIWRACEALSKAESMKLRPGPYGGVA